MGFRISFYKVKKDFRLRNSFKDSEDYEKYNDDFKKVSSCIRHDTSTSIYTDCDNTNNRLYTQIDDNSDTILGTVNKEQLYQWILEMKKKYLMYIKDILDRDEETGKALAYHDIRTKYSMWGMKMDKDENSIKNVEALALNLREDKDNNFLVAFGATYEYEIFNFISLYKHFNFDQYTLVMYGG